MTRIFGRSFWTEFFGLFFWTDFWTDFWMDFLNGFWDRFLDGFLDGFWDGFSDDELSMKFCWHSTLFFWGSLPFAKSTPKLHLRMVASWQINESTLRAWSSPWACACYLLHAPQPQPPQCSQSTHALCFSDSFSLSLCVPLCLLARAWAQLCQRDGHCWSSGPSVTQGGIFMVVGWGLWRDPEINNAIFTIQFFHLKSPLPICSHKFFVHAFQEMSFLLNWLITLTKEQNTKH